MDGSGHVLSYQPGMRPPPPTGPPPAYARTLTRIFPYSLRPVLFFTCFLSLLYLVLLGGNDFKDAGQANVSGRLKTLEIVQGILFVGAAAVELFGFFAVYTQRLPLAQIYSFASLGAFAAVIASEILGIVVVYTLKADVINSCTARNTGSIDDDGSIFGSDDNSAPLSTADAASYCQSLWTSNRTWDIVWLLITLPLGLLFVMLSFAYVRQLLDPSSVKVRISRFQQQHQQQQQPPNQGMHGPYDPEAAFSYPPTSSAYAPPSGPPPSGPGAPPMYSGRPSMDDWDDVKSPAGYGYGYNYGPGEREARQSNRAESSRNVAMHPDDVDDEEGGGYSKRDSGETLRGEDTVKKVDSSAGHYDDHDGTPRI